VRSALSHATRTVARRVRVAGSFSRNVVTTLATQGLLLLAGVGSSAITARLLGTSGKGIVAMVTLVQGLLVLFFNFGIGVSNVQFAGSRRESATSLTTNSIGFALAMAAVGVPLVGGAAALGWLGPVLPRVPVGYLLIGIIGFPIILLGTYFSAILQGLQRIPESNLSNLAQAGASLVLVVIFVLGLHWSVPGALLASVVAAAVGMTLRGVYLVRQGARLRPGWNGPAIRRMLAFGLRGQVGNLLQFFNYRMDVFVVNLFLGPSAVGVYSVAVTLAELLWQFPGAASQVIFPRAAGAAPGEMNRFTPRVFVVALGVTLLGAIGLAATGRVLIRTIFSQSFSGAYVPLLVLLPGVVLLGAGKVLTSDIAGRGYPQYNSVVAGIVLVMTIGLTLWWIPRYGILGAAAASSVAYAVAFIASLSIYRRVSRRALAPVADATPPQEIEVDLAREEGVI
jgi:O-antigen/teichoic acid export membrane protein